MIKDSISNCAFARSTVISNACTHLASPAPLAFVPVLCCCLHLLQHIPPTLASPLPLGKCSYSLSFRLGL